MRMGIILPTIFPYLYRLYINSNFNMFLTKAVKKISYVNCQISFLTRQANHLMIVILK